MAHARRAAFESLSHQAIRRPAQVCIVFRLKRLLKQKRKRLTTWQLIAQQVPCLDSFADLGHFVREELASAGCA